MAYKIGTTYTFAQLEWYAHLETLWVPSTSVGPLCNSVYRMGGFVGWTGGCLEGEKSYEFV